MKRIIIFAIVVLLLSSCIGFDSKMKFNNDGSGNLVFKYRVSQMFKSMGQKDAEGGESETQAPFPISKEKVEESLKGIKGLKVNSVKEWEDEQDVYVEVDLDFTKQPSKHNLTL